MKKTCSTLVWIQIFYGLLISSFEQKDSMIFMAGCSFSRFHLLHSHNKVWRNPRCILNPSAIYRVANKFSDTLNELFVVNCLISIFFCGNTRWKLVSSPHYLKILIKSTKHGLSYSLKRDLRPISKITFVSPFDTESWEFFLPKAKNAISYSNHHYLGKIKRLSILLLLFRPRYFWFK